MMRYLIESKLPQPALVLLMVSWNEGIGKGFYEIFWIIMQFFYLPIIAIVVPIYLNLPRTNPVRAAVPANLIAVQESLEFQFCRILITRLMILHMSLNTNYLVAALSFFYLGALVGCVFYGTICSKMKRRVALILAIVLSSAVLVVSSILTSNMMTRSLSLKERDFYSDGNMGSRKIRPFLDPNLAKALTNELSFEGAFSNEFNHCCLLLIFTGVALSTCSVTQTIFLDLWSTEVNSRHSMLIHSLSFHWLGPLVGPMFASMLEVQVNIPGAFIAILFHKVICLILVLGSVETKGWDRAVNVSGSPCYLKALYYLLYLWPQGSGHVIDMFTYMFHNRQHLRSSTAGHVSGIRWQVARPLIFFLISKLLEWLYIPTIGGMLFGAVLTPNPLNLSVCMDFFIYWRTVEQYEMYYYLIALYSPLAGQYMEITSIPLFLSFCEAFRNFGHFMAISRWPNQLFCGDPMNCWRSQYLYSHAIFYNCGGDQGNISYIVWYLFAKSQKRQCCCPYRKLKPDAPEKCCPPCCAGPLVEETGGCPCPCCCASCSA